MAQDISIGGTVYPAVPGINLLKTDGSNAFFPDTEGANATAADLLLGKTAYAAGQLLTGTRTAAVFPQLPEVGTAMLSATGQTNVTLPYDPMQRYYLVATFVYSYAGTHEIRACVYSLENGALTLLKSSGGTPVIALQTEAETVTATVGGSGYQYIALILIPA